MTTGIKDERVRVQIGSIVFEAPLDLCMLAGFSYPYSNDANRTVRDESIGKDASKRLAVALSEGLTGEAALLRAIALAEYARGIARELGSRQKIADTEAIATNNTRVAEAIRAKRERKDT